MLVPPTGLSLSPERTDFRPQRVYIRRERVGIRPFRPEETNRWMHGRSNKQKSPWVLQDFVPFRAAAQKRDVAGKKVSAKG